MTLFKMLQALIRALFPALSQRYRLSGPCFPSDPEEAPEPGRDSERAIETAGTTFFNYQENDGGRRTIQFALKVISKLTTKQRRKER